MSYHILLIEVSILPIEIVSMTKHLIYKYKVTNMKDKRLPKIAINSSENHLHLKRSWHKDAKSWLKH